MSDEETQNPGGGMLLEPEKRSFGSFLLPAALAAGGAALIYKAAKKSEKKSKASAPSAGDNEVAFSANHSAYSMGKDYEQLVLEPYLSEQAEDGNLHLKGQGSGLIGAIPMVENLMLDHTRKNVIAAFKATHRAKVGKDRVTISDLPQDKTGVQKFNEWLEEETKMFQENY
jgi:hypothetical protein